MHITNNEDNIGPAVKKDGEEEENILYGNYLKVLYHQIKTLFGGLF